MKTKTKSAPRSRARMRDVAQLAGVGTMTVSRVLSGSAPVSDETRVRVMEAVERLNYRPNEVARSLRESRTRSIGIIVPDFTDSFFANCAHSVNLTAQEWGYSVAVTTSSEDATAEYREASLMLRRNVDGLIIIPASHGATQLNLPEFDSIPIVAVDRPILSRNGHAPHVSSVLVENKTGARVAVEHLIGHGHRRILFLSRSNRYYTLNERHAGYLQAMRKAGLKAESDFSCSTMQSTLEALRSLKDEPGLPSAIFCSNNLATQHTMHALATLGVPMPGSVAVVGFDDLEMFEIFNPALTVIRQPQHDLGRIAAEMLFTHLKFPEREGIDNGKSSHVVLPVELIIRKSCGCGA